MAYKEQGNIDSAQFYFQKSLASEKDYKRPDIDFTTLSALGATYLQQKNYRKALIFFKSAEKIDARKNHINLQNLYSNIITTYSTLNIADSARIYQAKKDSLDLAIVKSQNKSLNKLLVEDKKHSDSWYKYGLIACFVIIVTLRYWVFRKNRILSEEEERSSQYLNENKQEPKGEKYSELMKMLKNNDPAFMVYCSSS